MKSVKEERGGKQERRRVANRASARKSRYREKIILSELQKSVADLTKSNATLRERNVILSQKLSLFQSMLKHGGEQMDSKQVSTSKRERLYFSLTFQTDYLALLVSLMFAFLNTRNQALSKHRVLLPSRHSFCPSPQEHRCHWVRHQRACLPHALRPHWRKHPSTSSNAVISYLTFSTVWMHLIVWSLRNTTTASWWCILWNSTRAHLGLHTLPFFSTSLHKSARTLVE